jgi:hypothetical protein
VQYSRGHAVDGEPAGGSAARAGDSEAASDAEDASDGEADDAEEEALVCLSHRLTDKEQAALRNHKCTANFGGNSNNMESFAFVQNLEKLVFGGFQHPVTGRRLPPVWTERIVMVRTTGCHKLSCAAASVASVFTFSKMMSCVRKLFVPKLVTIVIWQNNAHALPQHRCVRMLCLNTAVNHVFCKSFQHASITSLSSAVCDVSCHLTQLCFQKHCCAADFIMCVQFCLSVALHQALVWEVCFTSTMCSEA